MEVGDQPACLYRSVKAGIIESHGCRSRVPSPNSLLIDGIGWQFVSRFVCCGCIFHSHVNGNDFLAFWVKTGNPHSHMLWQWKHTAVSHGIELLILFGLKKKKKQLATSSPRLGQYIQALDSSSNIVLRRYLL